ncbi:MAG: ABC transporter permease [Candidatus Thermoplasmatota archaeon]|jgi:peptide/nickel transport system permease protein|nr:ABC transporter permease [Candidatus Thermoplasmatota archaeon]
MLISVQEKRKISRRRIVARDYVHTFSLFIHNRLAFFGLVIVLFYFAVAFLDAVYPQYLGVSNINTVTSFLHTTNLNAAAVPTPPTLSRGWWYWFGTTEYEVPILPTMLASLKVDIGVSLAIVISAAGIGLMAGTISGFFGGRLDEIIMRITDIFFGIPTLVLAIAIIYVIGRGILFLALALILVRWPLFARLSRGQSLSLRESKFIEAARISGSSRIRDVFVHIIPNVLSPIFVQISLELGTVVLTFATLDFLGFNVAPPLLPELGNMIAGFGSSGATDTYLAAGIWWPMVIPGLFLLLFTVAVNLMGDGLRDVLDPRTRR